jgi:hypothetical protein
MERGVPLPDRLQNPPDLPPEYRIYWTAFIDLTNDRLHPGSPIPWTAIHTYSTHLGVPVDDLKVVIWELDAALRRHWEAQRKSEYDRLQNQRNDRRE